MKYLVFTLGCLSVLCGLFGGVGYMIYSTVYAIFDLITIFKADTVSFGDVFWLCFLWCTREIVAGIIGIVGFTIGVGLIKASNV